MFELYGVYDGQTRKLMCETHDEGEAIQSFIDVLAVYATPDNHIIMQQHLVPVPGEHPLPMLIASDAETSAQYGVIMGVSQRTFDAEMARRGVQPVSVS